MPHSTPLRGTPTATGTLFVVATPIGNLEDITLRALRILREVAVVAAEDTRRTGNLLRHFDIHTPLVSLHEHNEHQRSSHVLERLRRGDSVALVSDAGTPGISDPGAHVVRAAREGGFRVEAIPGASAITAALSASGLTFDRFAFAGFPPVRLKDRNDWFAWVQSLPDTLIVCFEAPHRVRRTILDLQSKLGDRPIILARELTKAHEEWLFAPEHVPELGEFVVLIGQSTKNRSLPVYSDEEIAQAFGEITKTATASSRREAIRAVAQRLGVPTKTVYNALERAKN